MLLRYHTVNNSCWGLAGEQLCKQRNFHSSWFITNVIVHCSWRAAILPAETVQERWRPSWCHWKWNLASKASLWLGVSSGHRRKNVYSWPDVSTSSNEHVNHGLHDDVLQVSLLVCFTACWLSKSVLDYQFVYILCCSFSAFTLLVGPSACKKVQGFQLPIGAGSLCTHKT